MLASTYDELKEAFYAMRNTSCCESDNLESDNYDCSGDDFLDDDDADCFCG